MTGCGCVPISDSLRQSPAALGLFLGVEKRAQLASGPVQRLQWWGNNYAPSFMHSESSMTACFDCCSRLSTYSEALRA